MPFGQGVYPASTGMFAYRGPTPVEREQALTMKSQRELQERAYGQRERASAAAQGSMAQLVGQYNQAYGEARTANEQRYQQMLGISDQETQRRMGQYRQMLGVAGQTTQQRAADIRSSYAGREADVMQQLARQGMAGTTVAPTMRMGVQREQESALNRLADQMQGTKLGIMGQMAQPMQQGKLGIMERRTDEYPNQNVLMALAQAIGSGGGGANIASALGKMRMT